MESVISSFSARSRPWRNSVLASADEVVTGIFPPPAGVGAVASLATAGAGASFFAQPPLARPAATPRTKRRLRDRFLRIVSSFAMWKRGIYRTEVRTYAPPQCCDGEPPRRSLRGAAHLPQGFDDLFGDSSSSSPKCCLISAASARSRGRTVSFFIR